ncbi:MAG: FlgD immunoglobulin-like domain containing protein [bacterium]
MLWVTSYYYPPVVSGTVVAADGVTPMSGVEVSLASDGTIVAITNASGDYSFAHPSGTDTLVFSRSFHHATSQEFTTSAHGNDVQIPDVVMYGDSPGSVQVADASWESQAVWEFCPDENPSSISVWVDFDDDYMSTDVSASDVRLDLGAFVPGTSAVSSQNDLTSANGYVANFTVPIPSYCARGNLTLEYETISGPGIAWSGLAPRLHHIARYDLVADGALDLGDIGEFALANGSSEGDPNYNPCADYDGDGTIGLADLGSFAVALTGDRCSTAQAPSGDSNGLAHVSARLALSPARPNPFRDQVTFEYAVPADRNAEAHIYDVTGRHVRTLTSESRGRGTLSWDGRDSAGQRLASGIYFVRMELGAERVTRKVTLLD